MNDQNAMTEVALGLAMAFFAIFVLVLVSLGTPNLTAASASVEDLTISNHSDGRALNTDETFLIVYQGQILDQNLHSVSLSTITGPIVLGVMPDASIELLLDIQNRLVRSSIAITVLDDRWKQRLRVMNH